jgi:hypothetical protein
MWLDDGSLGCPREQMTTVRQAEGLWWLWRLTTDRTWQVGKYRPEGGAVASGFEFTLGAV